MHKYIRTTATFIATGMVALIIIYSLTPASASERENKPIQNNNSEDWTKVEPRKSSLKNRQRALDEETQTVNNSKFSSRPIGGVLVEETDEHNDYLNQKKKIQRQQTDLRQDNQRVATNVKKNIRNRIKKALANNRINFDKIENIHNEDHNHLNGGGTAGWFIDDNGDHLSRYNLGAFLATKITGAEITKYDQNAQTDSGIDVIIVEFNVGTTVGKDSRGNSLTRIRVLYDPRTSMVWNAFPY